VTINRRELKRVVGSGIATVVVLYTGIALVAVMALPVHGATPNLRGASSTLRWSAWWRT